MYPLTRHNSVWKYDVQFVVHMRFSHTIRGVTYGFADLKELLAKASPLRSGDELAGICAASAEERVAARVACQWPGAVPGTGRTT